MTLPADLTSFIGRWQETAHVVAMAGDARLVTLTGVGGVGKTRLALRAAKLLRPRYPDGACFVELSGLRDPALLGHTLSAALNLAEQAAKPQTEVLADYLRDRRLLLVLDTCEHLAEPCARLAELLLSAAPGLSILATSRSPLRLPAERCFAVEPLSVPDAMRLFAERAADQVPGFESSDEVRRLCLLLDGIPLAIELAAVRLRTLTAEQLIERIGDRFHLLSRGHASPPRHQALRTTIGWSHELCEPLERLLWARLSVFAGDFDLVGARAVCADERLPAELIERLVGDLVDKSIVRPSGDHRFRMLDTVRDYGAEWLRALGEQEATRRRHRGHYLALARRFDTEWFGPDQVGWYHDMRDELPNLRVALDYCFATPAEHLAGLDLVGRLGYLWQACGFIAEGHHHITRALRLCPALGRSGRRVLWLGAWVAGFQGDLDEADDLASECLVRSVAEDDREAAGWAASCIAIAGVYAGRTAEALSLYEHAQAFHEDSGDDGAGLAYTLMSQAYAHAELGRGDRACALLDRVRMICRARGDIWVDAYGDWIRSLVELARGNPAEADAYARSSLRRKQSLHDTLGMAAVLATLCGVAAELGQAERAARLLGVCALVQRTYALHIGISHLDAIRERAEESARRELGDEGFDCAYRDGFTRPIESAVTYAIEESSGVSRTESA